MADDWTMNVSSREPIASWEGAAATLRSLVEAISAPVEQSYGQPLIWRSETLDALAWRDPDQIAELLVSRRLRDDDGKVMPTLGATGTVQGYLGDQPNLDYWMTAAHYHVRGEPTTVQWKVRFSTRNGLALPLDRHPDEWLVNLLAATAVAAQANRATIYTTPLFDALDERGGSLMVGAISLAPHGVPTDALPDSLRVYDAPGYPSGNIVIADLDRLEDEPDLLVDDLLVLDAALSTRTGET